MKIELKNKYFYYNCLTNFIFNEILESGFFNSKKKKLDVGYIKWIYEKDYRLSQGMIFKEDEFFRVNIIKSENSTKKFDILMEIFYDDFNFINFNIILINCKYTDIFFLKRQLISAIARGIHKITNYYPFERNKFIYNDKKSINNNIFSKEDLIGLNVGFRAESLHYRINYLKCIKDFLLFKKNIYNLNEIDYTIITLDILENQY